MYRRKCSNPSFQTMLLLPFLSNPNVIEFVSGECINIFFVLCRTGVVFSSYKFCSGQLAGQVPF